MSTYDKFLSYLPGVEQPKKYINFKKRLMWTGLCLILFLIMGQITLYGVAPETLAQFRFFEMILGSSIGSLVTLGIGPIVTASIILQLLVGSKIITWNLKTQEGKQRFQGSQKLLAIFFCIFESIAFVSFGAITPIDSQTATYFLLISQIAIGSVILIFMDETVSKWGIGSGISLFIAAGVTKQIFVGAFNPLTTEGQTIPAGLIPQFFSFISLGDTFSAITSLLPIIAMILVFVIVVYVQSMKVEIPLAFGSIRGFGRRWPLKLIYTTVIPVILVAALIANLQLVGSSIATPVDEFSRCGFLGCFDTQGQPISGIASYLIVPNSIPIQIFSLSFLSIMLIVGILAFFMRFQNIGRVFIISITISFVIAILVTNNFIGLPTMSNTLKAIFYYLFYIFGATLFSVFWISTSGMDSKSVAEQIQGMGMQVPGFRRDPRIVEQVLERYIPTLAIISGLFIGSLAAFADFTQALGTGTGILLTVMVVYSFYEQISQKYMEDMHPSLRKFFG